MRNPKAMKLLAPLQKISRKAVPRFDYHMHTNWTDGENSISDMYSTAFDKNLNAVLFSEHVRKSSEEWFLRFATEIRALPKERCIALTGMETRVCDFSGTLDCTQAMIDECDLVIGSVHRFPDKLDGGAIPFSEVSRSEALEIEYELMIAILNNPNVDVLGHPFGMSIKKYNTKPSRDKLISLIQEAAKNKVAVEINSSYHSNPWEIIEWCLFNGAMISLGSDAHSAQKVGSIVEILERGV